MIGVCQRMKANQLLKHNIDTLLKERHQTRRDLASAVRQSLDPKKIDPWISKIFGSPDAEFQTKYLDRIADFFGFSVYQLFQPGISHLTERRKHLDRRSGRDRRISHLGRQIHAALSPASAHITEEDIADLIRLRALTADSRAVIRQEIDTLDRAEREAAAQRSGRRGADTAPGAATTAASRGRRRRPARSGVGG